jgi:GNAT superfamily N-acetyltransferase
VDTPVILDLIKEFCEIDNHIFDEKRITNALTPLLADSSLGLVVLLEKDEQPVGYAVLTWGWSIESGGREGLIDEIYLKERNQGLGSLLLTEVFKIAQDNEVKIIFLETELANSRVRDFYLRHGFKQDNSIWLSHSLSTTD